VKIGPHYRRVMQAAEEQCVPLSVTFELGQACNLRCVHCYNFDRELPRHPDSSRGDELSSDEIHRVIDEIRAEGALFLTFTGGEPLSQRGLEAYVAHAAHAGMLVRLKTNAALMARDRIEALARHGLRAADVSLYAATAPIHDAFVRSDGAFDRTMAGIRNARDAGVEIRLSLVISTANERELPSMIDLAHAMEIPFTVDTHITARHDRSRSSTLLALDGPALERLYRGPLAEFVRPSRRKDGRIACPCARSVCGIGSSGEVYPCIAAPLPCGNVRIRSFREIWRESPQLRWVRGLRNEDFAACACCAHSAFCHRSSGTMLTDTGSFTGPSRYGESARCVEAEIVHRLSRATPRPADP
jgi:radical SAM protein with 4Fe4S-binding SPASM domain